MFQESIFYKGGSHAVLLLPGLSSTPLEMRPVAKALHRDGYTVCVPHIEGYGLGTPCTNWRAWIAAARTKYRELRDTHVTVSVCGLSMGATLSLAVAQEEPDVTALSLLAVTLVYDGWTIPWYYPLIDLVYHTPLRNRYRYQEKAPFGLKNEALRARVAKSMSEHDASEVGAASLPLAHLYNARRLAAHVRERLGRVTADCLIIHAVDDDTSSPHNARLVYNGVSSAVKQKCLLGESYHILTMDNERETVADETRRFFRDAVARRTGAASSETRIISKALLRARRRQAAA
ncbi:alpha/beta fold hydrolase [Pandoraea nosoerga]|uniref:Carboxylesterase n=1 Tax=Pandoraea nosoerga TaxID=2508296 RepID=A0A5E4XU24_9BURK|nr:alpha/beta fold hydrolase [Pandoraea nosoerga]MBN4667528.1 alpha/beta fold hydrolase [Pandoraea nosoerga]MBN4674858.1 alpha/beta fold hydrolase [Pandoraea nosoerga]MBN4680174.1 alpha/beta fold hydrolase [Pandoraea nosoerga]MBN4744592.1 alpha/beta fold hydrolase [Pandoraea nosoerga]VVE39961.1 carboxylesterase [Pandoraea nosoerga]